MGRTAKTRWCSGRRASIAFKESQQPKPDKQTRLDATIQTEKERKIKEYQRSFLIELDIIKEELYDRGKR